MLIGAMDIANLMTYMKQVKKENLKDREEFRNKRAKTSSHKTGKKGAGNESHPPSQSGSSSLVPSSASALVPKVRHEKRPRI